MARSKGRRGGGVTWAGAFYETAKGHRPAHEFLARRSMPTAVREQLLVIIASVLNVGPPRFPTSTAMWRLMHKPKKKGEIDLSGICEARDKHSRTLYRLFCVLDRDAPKHRMAAPLLVLLTGVEKPDGTTVPQAKYRVVDGMRDDYLRTRRVARRGTEGLWWPSFEPTKEQKS